MTDFPPGTWSSLIIGDQWPDAQDVIALNHGTSNRGLLKTEFTEFANILKQAQSGPLNEQRGHTVEDLRNEFRLGERHARRVADKNGIKENAYATARDSMLTLRHDLTSLADAGNKEIEEIQDSNEPAEMKVAQIVAAIQQYRTLANLTAAKYSGNVLDAMQRILDEEGSGQSARQFAQTHGLDVGRMFTQHGDQNSLTEQVQGALKPGSVLGVAPGPNSTEPGSPLPGAHPVAGASSSAVGIPEGWRPPSSVPAPLPPGQVGLGTAMGLPAGYHPGMPSSTPARPSTSAPAGAPAPPTAEGPWTSAIRGPGALMPPLPSPAAPLASAPGSLLPSGASPTPPLTPTELVQGFDKGMQTGTPFSAAEPLPSAPVSPTQQIPDPPPTAPSPTANVPVHAQALDTPAPLQHHSAPEAPPPTPLVAAPAPPAAATPIPTGALPAYASDLRPTIPAGTTPAAPATTPSPPSATPSSASVHPSGGQAGTGQPTVVRQSAPLATTSQPSATPTQAVAATATGATAGAASAHATARARLQRLVFAVARQQPRLAWAAGVDADNATVLATDLASGWIPPGIELPAAVRLLQPARRRGDLEALIGAVTVAAGYTPTHYVPDEDEPVPTSPRPRTVPEIAELGWELSQATQWRDGLPRLAHTLAKAASAETGVLDSEIDLLHEHLAKISIRVLDSYPGDVDAHDVGNWQLLAAIDALVAGDKLAANYHLAWFQASRA